jgi:fatty-acyl-CoA synthase
MMAVPDITVEIAALDARARSIIDECPDVFRLIARGTAIDPEHEAIVYLRTPLDPAPIVTTARSFLGLVSAAGRWLRENGVGPDDTVSILAPNCTAVSVAYWSAMSFATVHPLNLLFSRDAIEAQLAAARTKILFTPPPGAPGGLFEKVEGVADAVPTLQRIVTLPLDGSVAFGDETLSPDFAWRDPSLSAASHDRVVAILPTGGTTGVPKAARLTNRNVTASAVASMLAFDGRPGDRILIALPLFHVGGAFVGALSALAAGATQVIPTAAGLRNPEVIKNFWRIVEAQRITIGALVPTALGAVAEALVGGADISSLRLFATGASVCPPEIERRFLAAWPGDCVRQVYGMTEFAGAITQTPHNAGQKPGSVGFPVALAEVAVLAGGELHRGPSPTGEIVARGPQVFAGYADSRHGRGAFHDGWLKSGDLGRIGADGEIYVTGRIKDVIIRGGHNIDPAGIEDAALGFPGVALAAAVGRPDPYSGETPMLFVSPSAGASIDCTALGHFVEGRIMETPARPRAIVVIPEMPLTPVGKIFKPRLREIAAEAATRDMIASAAPGLAADVCAATEVERGLVVTVKAPFAHCETLRAELGKLPLTANVVAI